MIKTNRHLLNTSSVLKLKLRSHLKSHLKSRLKMNMTSNMSDFERSLLKHEFVSIMYECYYKYFKHGSRSSQKVDHFHNYICKTIDQYIKKNFDGKKYTVKTEQWVPSFNSSGKKKCDIVVFDENEKPCLVFPVKIVMTNYKQNKNNSWENQTGELMHLKWANDNLKIVPINVFPNQLPYLNKDGNITKFEKITYKDIKIYDTLVEKNIVDNLMNFILDVEHESRVDEKYDKSPKIHGFDKETSFISMQDVLKELLVIENTETRNEDDKEIEEILDGMDTISLNKIIDDIDKESSTSELKT